MVAKVRRPDTDQLMPTITTPQEGLDGFDRSQSVNSLIAHRWQDPDPLNTGDCTAYKGKRGRHLATGTGPHQRPGGPSAGTETERFEDEESVVKAAVSVFQATGPPGARLVRVDEVVCAL